MRGKERIWTILSIAGLVAGLTGIAEATEIVVTPGLRVSVPLGGSISVTTVVGQKPRHRYCHQEAGGVLLQGEAGTGGGQIGLGYGFVGTSCGGMGVFPLFGGGVKAVVTRTWDNPWLATPRSTYVGAQADMTLMYITLRLGAIYRLAANPSGHRWVVTIGGGVGF